VTFPIPVERVIPLDNGDFLVEGTTFPGYEDLYEGNPKKLKLIWMKERK